ncbi:MAG: ABC transporter permease [Emcibacteraceae bacterium]|nr:ABC transporter permease [Emcibacteraceae bacterium]
MIAYIVKKMLLAIPTLFIVALIVFCLMRSIPGDPAMILAGDINDPLIVEQIRKSLGLDQPLPMQFFLWGKQVLSGNLGFSAMTGEPVFETMSKRIGVTALLVVPALILSVLFAVPAGLYAAWNQNKKGDITIMVCLIVAISIPSFWMGMMLILIFGVWLGWLPTVGYVPFGEDFWQAGKYMILPVISIMLVEMATITRMMRSNAIEVLRQDYITHARAKGVSERNVLLKHTLKNSFAPTLTLIGLMLGSLLGGAAVVETVFSIPGIGRLLVDSIYARDYAVVQGILLFVSLIYVITNLLVDVLYPFFDPRVKL